MSDKYELSEKEDKALQKSLVASTRIIASPIEMRKEIQNLQNEAVCFLCNGTGKESEHSSVPCLCKGSGKLIDTAKLLLKNYKELIKAYSDQGSELYKLKNQCTECPLNRRHEDHDCMFLRRQAD